MKQESIVQSNNELLNDKRVLMVNPKDEVSVKTIKTDSRVVLVSNLRQLFVETEIN